MRSINHYTDFANAEKLASSYDAVISLGFKLDDSVFGACSKRLFLDFADITLDQVAMCGGEDKVDFADAPKEEHILSIIDFVRKLEPSDKLLVHCVSGYRRSPAGVIIARCERDNISVEQAEAGIAELRVPDKLVPDPNSIMLRLYELIKHKNAKH